MTATPESLRADLGKIAQGQKATSDATANIRRAAEERLEEVQARLTELRTTVLVNNTGADEYQALIEERGTLARVLGIADA